MRKTLAQELGLSLEQINVGLELLAQPRTIRRRGVEQRVDPRIIREGNRVFLSELHAAEIAIAKHFRRLQSAKLPKLVLPENAFNGKTPDASQLAAVNTALESEIMLVTGGPGTGKTTVCRAIIAAYEADGAVVIGCAPTGKAAQRMKQQTGRQASTIHNAIGLVPGKEPRHNDQPAVYSADDVWIKNGPMDCGAVIVDETSMVDVELMADLLCAIPTGARVLIVGDVDQLPSIGAGRVLFDLIESKVVPCARLTKIHRQASESRIPYVARDINEGRIPDLNVTGSDFTHWQTTTEEEAAERIVRALTDETGSITARKGIPTADIQVLAPQYKGPCGVIALNQQLQEKLNPAANGDHNGDVFIGRGYSARLRDRVIQTRNNYELGPVMNGEMGYVVACDPSGLDVADFIDELGGSVVMWSGKEPKEEKPATGGDDWMADGEEFEAVAPVAEGPFAEVMSKFGGLTVTTDDEGDAKLEWEVPRVLVIDFGDGRRVAYTRGEAKELELGYCVTVHRSQGSQFKAVVISLFCVNSFMMTRALLYTAVTRAEVFCLTVGTSEQIGRAARNIRGTERRTVLQERLAKTPTSTASSSLEALTYL